MLSLDDASDRAMRRAIETGEMADMSFIHTVQRAEGYQSCFGRTEEPCPQMRCRWNAECVALANTAESNVFARLGKGIGHDTDGNPQTRAQGRLAGP
jgi:hypothetical protein